MNQTNKKYDALIIGAGFSGMYMLHKLRQQGLSVRVFEAASDVGGTWYWSRYPGAKCDSESIYYNFTFSEDLYKKWSWSERYGSQEEILRYLNFVADELDLRKDMQFNTKIISSHYDENLKGWRIGTDQQETLEAKYLITGVGCLSTTNLPVIEGIDLFEGEIYHTGRWPHQKVDFSGKRVAVIGTGSSGAQSIPVIAEEAGQVTVFMRTPHYVAEARNRPLSEEEQQQMKDNYEAVRDYFVSTVGGINLYSIGKSALEISEEERKKILEYVWENGGLSLGSVFTDITINPEANDKVSEFVREKIREIVEDQDLAEQLLPDYYLATKRLIISTNFYETFNRDNVSLVKIKENPIERITETGIQTSQEHYDFDMIVFATGYEAMTGSLLKIDICGRDGQSINNKWNNGHDVKTYLGLTMNNFPNLFMITGPQSPSVLTNMPAAIEQHVDWISDCIAHMEKNQLDSIEADVQAEILWNEQCTEIANYTLYPQTDSWYTGANIDGKQRGFVIYVGGLDAYRKICQEVADKNYQGFQFEQTTTIPESHL